MESSTSKQLILGKIRKALNQPVRMPYSKSETEGQIFSLPEEDLSVIFATEFTRLLGKFAYCASLEELSEQVGFLMREKGWKKTYCQEEPLTRLFHKHGMADFANTQDLATCDVSFTGCEHLVARTGTIVLSAAQPHGRTASVYAPVHVCIARTSQLVFDISDALTSMKKRYEGVLPSVISFATGPSRTADIEKTLVVGVHGPKEVYCILMEDDQLR